MDRRSFLFGWTRELRSHKGESVPEAIRDNVIEKGGEAVALAVILYLAWAGSQKRLKRYTTVPESLMINRPDANQLVRPAELMTEMVQPIADSLTQLEKAWTAEYQETRVVSVPKTVTTCDSKGSCTSTSTTELKTETYWAEPPVLTRQGFTHNTIGSIKRYFTDITEKSSGLLNDSGQAFNFKNGPASVQYIGEDVDQKAQFNLALAMYAAIGGSFVFYEEGAELFSKFSGTEMLIDEDRFMKRRTFLKLAVAVLGAAGIRKLQDTFSQNNQNLLTELRAHTDQIIRETDLTNEQMFNKFFGQEARNIGAQIDSGIQIFEKVSQAKFEIAGWDLSGVNHEIRVKIDETLKVLKSGKSMYSETLQDGVSENLATLLKFVWATRNIRGYSDTKSALVDTHHLIDGTALALVLGATMAIAEAGVFPLLDDVIDGKKF